MGDDFSTPHRDDNTSKIVRQTLMPRVDTLGEKLERLTVGQLARGWKFVVAVCSACIFIASCVVALVLMKAETKAEAKAKEQRHAEEHQKLDEQLGRQDRDIAEIKGYVRAAAENSAWLRQRHEREDKRRGR